MGFLLLVTGLRPGTVGLTFGTLDEAFVFLTVRLATLETGLDAPSLGFAVFRGTATVSFVEDGLLTLFFGSAVSSALTSAAISSISLAASSLSMVDADNNSATERRRKRTVMAHVMNSYKMNSMSKFCFQAINSGILVTSLTWYAGHGVTRSIAPPPTPSQHLPVIILQKMGCIAHT